ncbi:MAG TPA: hypothetical protein VM553_00705 [Dongiaceae bacterium]|nr:hypothetical protein [Dongiaceae bacterium]
MGFYMKQPVNPKKIKVVYLWTSEGTPGIYSVEVQGEAQSFSAAFELTRDPNFIGGLKIDVMGWTGPSVKGITPYRVCGSFPGHYIPRITISGSNGDFSIKVAEIPHYDVDEHIRQRCDNVLVAV